MFAFRLQKCKRKYPYTPMVSAFRLADLAKIGIFVFLLYLWYSEPTEYRDI